MTIASSELLLSILPNEYETPTVGGLVRRGRRRGRSQAGRSYDLRRSSIRSRCILEGWIWRLRPARGTAHATRMRITQSPPRGLTSTKGRSFGLSYVEMATSPRDGCDALDFEQDWLIIGRFLDVR
jgi:hypothetical protein